MCVCKCVCVYIHIYSVYHTYTYICASTYIHACMHACIHTYTSPPESSCTSQDVASEAQTCHGMLTARGRADLKLSSGLYAHLHSVHSLNPT